MTKERLLHLLFDAHMQDLQEVRPDLQEVVACPICLRIFPREAIVEKQLTDGHVWPKEVRKGSRKAANMRIILCKDCNNAAGSHGDKQMQLFEHVKKGDETGELYGKRVVKIIINPEETPIEMLVNVVRHLEDNSITITGRLDKDLNWLDGSPEDQVRFKEIYEAQKPVAGIVNPYQELRPEVVRAGWITSAYLMAFYGLGYRYILHRSLNPIRQYIQQSFVPITAKALVNPKANNFIVREYKDNYFPDPELLFIYPLESGKLVYLQINCLKYEIRLPFRFVKNFFDGQIKKPISDLGVQIPEPNKGYFLYFPVLCTKIEKHECWFDFLLGKPLPDIPK